MQHYYRLLIRLGLIYLTGWVVVSAAAQQATSTPAPAPSEAEISASTLEPAPSALTAETIQDKISEIESSKELAEELKGKLLEVYQQAQEHLQIAQNHQQLAAEYHQAITNVPPTTETLRQQLQAMPAATIDSVKVAVPQDADAQQLELLRAKEQADLATVKNALEKLEGDIRNQEEREVKAPEEKVVAKAKVEEIDNLLKVAPPEGEPALMSEASRLAWEAHRIMRVQELAKLEQETLSQAVRIDLLRAQTNLRRREITRSEMRLKQLEELANQRRSQEARVAERQAETTRKEAVTQQKHPLIVALAQKNSDLGRELGETVRNTNDVIPDRRFKQDQLQYHQSAYERAEAMLEHSSLGGMSSEAIREQYQRLPAVLRDNRRVARRWQSEIARAGARRFEIGFDIRDLSNLDQVVRQRIDKEVEATIPKDLQEEIAAEVLTLLTSQQELLTQLNNAYASYLTALRELETIQKDLDETIKKLSSILDEWVLWSPSAPWVNHKTISALGRSFAWFLSTTGWLEVGRLLLGDLRQWSNFLPWLLVTLVIGLLYYYRQRFRARIEDIAGRVGRIYTDKFSLTVEAFILSLLLVLPIPLALGFMGWRLREVAPGAESSLIPALSAGLLTVAQLVLSFRFFMVICQPRNVAEVHFRWREEPLRLVRRHLRWLFVVLIATSFITTLSVVQPDEEIRNSLGRLAFVIMVGAQAVFLQRVLHPKGAMVASWLTRHPQGWISRLRYLWYPLVVGVPAVLAGVALAGYFYTSQELERHVISTAWLVVGAIVISDLLLRWFVVEQRRLAVQNARERKEALAAREEAMNQEGQGALPAPEAEIPEVDFVQIRDQSRQLIHTLAGIVIVIGIWLIWAPVLPALGILDEVKLWDIQVPDESGQLIPRAITLQSLALAVIALILTGAAARNLPGVLEVVVLKNLPLEAGTRYAVTTVSQYILVVIGMVFAFNFIGLNWSKVQWLVAALSVGIGFGLQEIIANFICGLILLFERPIRVGDIVTVGDVMGIVSRIRIRATTITNWDRMDYVVPNKDLITGRLLNWTLSNSVNRIVINVGVAYGSDTEKARERLLKVANDHPLIMDDPAPLALFDGFGNSTLNLVLRCYLPDFANRLGTIHELHTAIDKAFKQAGIEIAFPQMDLHFKSAKVPLEVLGGGIDQPSSSST